VKKASASRKARSGGAELIEFALLMVPIFLMTFMILDLSMVIFIRCTFQNAVRDGVRYAITGANSTGPGQDDSIKAVVKTDALGFLNGTTAAATMHVHWIDPVTGAVANNSMGNIVEVSVEAYKYSPLAPYLRLGYPLNVWARAYDVMQYVPGTLPSITKVE
jgi:Flp pilus assembly protein TadG